MTMTVRMQISSGLLLSLAVVASTSAQGGSTVPTTDTVLVRMAQARAENQARFRPYVVTRDYTLFGDDRSKSKAEVTAEVTFIPPNSKEFSIQHSSGSGLGEKLVRRMLEGETQIVKDYGSTDISPDNYDFHFVGEEEFNNQRCYVLTLAPKRKDKTLLRGKMWVDANSYLLRRIEAEPAKGPSWWLRDVRILFYYGYVRGMWLQTASEFTTNVRLFGRHTMTSRDVKYEPVELAGADVLEPRPLPQANKDPEPRCSASCAPDQLKGNPAGQRSDSDATKSGFRVAAKDLSPGNAPAQWKQ